MKLLAVIVLYNPNCEDVYSNIMSYIQAIDKLIIWNNSGGIELKSFGWALGRIWGLVMFIIKLQNMP